MTKLKYTPNPRWRQSVYIDQSTGRPICIAVRPASILLRLKGTRKALELPLGVAYLRAAYMEAARIKLEKVKARKPKRSV